MNGTAAPAEVTAPQADSAPLVPLAKPPSAPLAHRVSRQIEHGLGVFEFAAD
jgi:hypothetical protein